MTTPLDDINKLKSYEDIIADRIAEWEGESIASIAREVAKIGKMSKEDAEKLDVEKAAKKQWERIIAALAVVTVLNGKDMKNGYKYEFEQWHGKNRSLYEHVGKDFKTASHDETLQNALNAAAKRDVSTMVNYTDTTALCVYDRNGVPVRGRDAIQKAFKEAVDNVVNGNTNFTEAMRQTIEQLGGGGVRVRFESGVTRRLDTVVRANMMYGLKKANAEYERKIGEMIGADGYEIDMHQNSRPSHIFMQGKQYCIEKTRKIGGTVFVGFEERDPTSPEGQSASEALDDYGCRHYITPIICGISEPRWTKEQIEQSKKDHAKEYEIDDVKGNKYFWTQKMRKIETQIRYAKDEIEALRALGGNQATISKYKAMITRYLSEYDKITTATGIDGDVEWKRRMVKFAKNHK